MNADAARQGDFVPFGPASLAANAVKADGASNLKVIKPTGESGESFSPLLSATGTLHGAGKTHTAASVSVQKNGERISSIRVECACGQVIELSCGYDA